MEKDKLPPIPTPASQRWREFRIQFLPIVVFALILAGIVYLWRGYVQPIGVIGFADTNVVNVTTLQDGMISELLVERFQYVKAGQPIAVVMNTDPELVKAQIESAQAEVKMMQARTKVDIDRTAQAFQEFKQDYFKQRIDQATDQVEWINASNQFLRAETLYKQGSGPLADVDSARAERDAYAAAIEERGKQIEELGKSLAILEKDRKSETTDAINPFLDAVEKKAKELELMLKPSTLKAPISGMVSLVHHVAGERVLRGMPVVSITDPETRRIIGYVRQPVTDIPTTNDYVRITRSTQPRMSGRGQIVHIGAALETINPALLSVDTTRMEVGLPIVVTVPPGIQLLPGEYVSLVIERNPQK